MRGTILQGQSQSQSQAQRSKSSLSLCQVLLKTIDPFTGNNRINPFLSYYKNSFDLDN
jgi:hypothetical protein